MANLVESIKKAAIDVVEVQKPTAIFFGTVMSVSPLEINIEQKIRLTKEQLILTQNVTGHGLDTGLKAGEKVVLIRMQGGQKFIVVDRVGVIV